MLPVLSHESCLCCWWVLQWSGGSLGPQLPHGEAEGFAGCQEEGHSQGIGLLPPFASLNIYLI